MVIKIKTPKMKKRLLQVKVGEKQLEDIRKLANSCGYSNVSEFVRRELIFERCKRNAKSK